MRFRVVPVKNYFIRMIIIMNYHMTYRQSRQIKIWTCKLHFTNNKNVR